jgi:hypothetical protein
MTKASNICNKTKQKTENESGYYPQYVFTSAPRRNCSVAGLQCSAERCYYSGPLHLQNTVGMKLQIFLNKLAFSVFLDSSFRSMR